MTTCLKIYGNVIKDNLCIYHLKNLDNIELQLFVYTICKMCN